jgi:hypothetical protein
LTEIYVNDRPIDLVEEAEIQAKTLRELGILSFKTRDVVELFKESLQLAPRICDALMMDCEDVEGFFANQQMQEAQERIGELTSLLEWLLQLISGMQSLGGEKIESMSYGDVKVVDSVQRMQVLLGGMHGDLAAQNYDKFRVALRGDFKSEISTWKNIFNDASEKWQPQVSGRES